MASNTLTTTFRVQAANLFIQSIGPDVPTAYMFIAEPTPHQTNTLPDVYDDTLDTEIGTYRNLIAGKAIQASDVCLAIRNIPYVSGRVYDMYDDGNPLFFSSSYYAIVNAGTFYHVWKVLDNNMGANSLVAPDISDYDVNDELYETSDGYRWKYMYSVDTFAVAKFATPYWFPLVPNTSVSQATVAGALDIVQIDTIGEGYSNWVTGTFSTGDIAVSGNVLLYSLASNTSAVQIPGYYTGCVLYISSGTGVGGFQTIVNSFANPNGNFVVLAQELTQTPQNGSEFEIYPEVMIYSDGQQTTPARARALINATGNSVYRVEILN